MVIAVSVDLDCQPVLGPTAVEASRVQPPVGHWEGEARFAQPCQEARLELAECHVDVAMQNPPQRSRAGLCGRPASTASTWLGVVP